jgi:N-acetylneuraminic acid mutarotase
MKKLLISICVFSAISFATIAQDYWQQKDSVNGSGKAVCGFFVLQNEGYIVGGLDEYSFKRKMYSYNPGQNDWDNELSIGGLNGDGLDRGSASTFSIGPKGYLCLGQGQTNPYFKDTWEYDSETGAWSQKADFIGTARRQAFQFAVDGFAYVGGGQDATGLKKDFYKYDPTTNIWTQLNDFAGTARRQATSFAMGAEGYVGTGDDGVLKNDFWMYVPSSDSWIQKANFPGTPRAGAVSWGIFPTGYIATGEDNTFSYKKDVWEYNYFANVWVQRTDLAGPARKNAVAFVIDGIAYLGTGYNGTFLDDFYAYNGIVGLDENTQTFTSNCFPNPSVNEVFISGNLANLSQSSVQVFSATGSLVTDQIVVSTSGTSLKLSIDKLAPGNYIYKLKSSDQTSTSSGKIIKL